MLTLTLTLPARGPELANQAARERHQRHPRGRDGPGQDAAEHIGARLPQGGQGHRRAPPGDRAQVDHLQLRP